LLALLGAHHILHVSRIRVNMNKCSFENKYICIFSKTDTLEYDKYLIKCKRK
jgi:hypothetical protein